MIENAVGTFSPPARPGAEPHGQRRATTWCRWRSRSRRWWPRSPSRRRSSARRAASPPTPTSPLMIGQVQVTRYGDPDHRRGEDPRRTRSRSSRWPTASTPRCSGGAAGPGTSRSACCPRPRAPRGEPLLVVHLIIDTQEAMGANLINTMAEGVAPLVEQITGGQGLPAHPVATSPTAGWRARAAASRCEAAGRLRHAGRGDRRGHRQASALRPRRPVPGGDPQQGHHERHRRGGHRHRPGLAGDRGRGPRLRLPRRPVPAAVHSGTLEDGHLVGRIELPLALGTVGGPIQHPPRRAGWR